MSVKQILFVCTGNSCRSVMAQGYLAHLLQRAGLGSVTVESAGMFAMEGMTPTRETLRVLQAIGVEMSGHRARMLRHDMVEASDLILVMELFQLEELLRRYPSARGKAYLLKPYGLASGEGEGNPNIADPIGKPLEVYEVCFTEIRDAVDRVAKALGVHTR